MIALASGAKTYKLKFGHRSHNQPVLEVGTNKAYLTSQNHGFAVDNETIQKEWKSYFENLNDESNEGLKHNSKPIFTTQFHPEASSGPTDTAFLFGDFIKAIVTWKREQINKILILGSGALKIGEAGEFDYSGSQALKALKEEGIETVLINPNIATVQTSEGIADHIYFLPITSYFVEQVIQKEKPEGIITGFWRPDSPELWNSTL